MVGTVTVKSLAVIAAKRRSDDSAEACQMNYSRSEK